MGVKIAGSKSTSKTGVTFDSNTNQFVIPRYPLSERPVQPFDLYDGARLPVRWLKRQYHPNRDIRAANKFMSSYYPDYVPFKRRDINIEYQKRGDVDINLPIANYNTRTEKINVYPSIHFGNYDPGLGGTLTHEFMHDYQKQNPQNDSADVIEKLSEKSTFNVEESEPLFSFTGMPSGEWQSSAMDYLFSNNIQPSDKMPESLDRSKLSYQDAWADFTDQEVLGAIDRIRQPKINHIPKLKKGGIVKAQEGIIVEDPPIDEQLSNESKQADKASFDFINNWLSHPSSIARYTKQLDGNSELAKKRLSEFQYNINKPEYKYFNFSKVKNKGGSLQEIKDDSGKTIKYRYVADPIDRNIQQTIDNLKKEVGEFGGINYQDKTIITAKDEPGLKYYPSIHEPMHQTGLDKDQYFVFQKHLNDQELGTIRQNLLNIGGGKYYTEQHDLTRELYPRIMEWRKGNGIVGSGFTPDHIYTPEDVKSLKMHGDKIFKDVPDDKLLIILNDLVQGPVQQQEIPKAQDGLIIQEEKKQKNKSASPTNIVEKQKYWDTLPLKYGWGVKNRQNYMDIYNEPIPPQEGEIRKYEIWDTTQQSLPPELQILKDQYLQNDTELEQYIKELVSTYGEDWQYAVDFDTTTKYRNMLTKSVALSEAFEKDPKNKAVYSDNPGSWKQRIESRTDIENPALLFSSIMDEGAAEGFKYPYHGFQSFGLDTFGNRIDEFIKAGYVPEDMKDRVFPTNEINEKGEYITTARFTTLDDVITAKNAFFKSGKNVVQNTASKLGLTLSPDAMNYFTIASFNYGPNGVQRMIEDFNSKGYLDGDKFLQMETLDIYPQVHRNALRRLQTAKMLEGEGIITTNKTPKLKKGAYIPRAKKGLVVDGDDVPRYSVPNATQDQVASQYQKPYQVNPNREFILKNKEAQANYVRPAEIYATPERNSAQRAENRDAYVLSNAEQYEPLHQIFGQRDENGKLVNEGRLPVYDPNTKGVTPELVSSYLNFATIAGPIAGRALRIAKVLPRNMMIDGIDGIMPSLAGKEIVKFKYTPTMLKPLKPYEVDFDMPSFSPRPSSTLKPVSTEPTPTLEPISPEDVHRMTNSFAMRAAPTIRELDQETLNNLVNNARTERVRQFALQEWARRESKAMQNIAASRGVPPDRLPQVTIKPRPQPNVIGGGAPFNVNNLPDELQDVAKDFDVKIGQRGIYGYGANYPKAYQDINFTPLKGYQWIPSEMKRLEQELAKVPKIAPGETYRDLSVDQINAIEQLRTKIQDRLQSLKGTYYLRRTFPKMRLQETGKVDTSNPDIFIDIDTRGLHSIAHLYNPAGEKLNTMSFIKKVNNLGGEVGMSGSWEGAIRKPEAYGQALYRGTNFAIRKPGTKKLNLYTDKSFMQSTHVGTTDKFAETMWKKGLEAKKPWVEEFPVSPVHKNFRIIRGLSPLPVGALLKLKSIQNNSTNPKN